MPKAGRLFPVVLQIDGPKGFPGLQFSIRTWRPIRETSQLLSARLHFLFVTQISVTCSSHAVTVMVSCDCSVIQAEQHWYGGVVDCRWSKANLLEPILSFLHVARTQVVRRGGRCLNPRSIPDPLLIFHWLGKVRQLNLTYLVQRSRNLKASPIEIDP